MTDSKQNKLKLLIPNEIIQNKGFNLSNLEFYAYARLLWMYFRNYQCNEIELDHKKFMLNLGITDTRTLKKVFQNLFRNGLIENEIKVLPKRTPVKVVINIQAIEGKNFTMIPVSVFNWVEKIEYVGFRLLFYYKSFVNSSRDFCFAGFETICSDLKIGRETLTQTNEKLKKLKLISIEKHCLANTYEYDENDEMVFSRYNNHYRVLTQNI